MSAFDEPPRYRSFLVTMWEERSQNPDSPAVWRFRLEDPRSNRRRGFAPMGALVSALQKELAALSLETTDEDNALSGPILHR